jgi:hypothetical protein
MRSPFRMRSSLLSTSSRRERLLAEVMDHQSDSERKDEAQPPLLTGASVRRSSASCPGEWQEALSLPNLRAEHPLLAWPTSGDLFICAKDLFIAAVDGKSPSRLTGRGKLSRAERHQSSALSALLHHAGPNAS